MGHVELEIPVRHPCRETEKEGGNTSLEFMGKLRLRSQVWE